MLDLLRWEKGNRVEFGADAVVLICHIGPSSSSQWDPILLGWQRTAALTDKLFQCLADMHSRGHQTQGMSLK